jgi:hypothetical protein
MVAETYDAYQTSKESSAIGRPGLDWADDDGTLPKELELEHIRLQFGLTAVESLTPGSLPAEIGHEAPVPLETKHQENPFVDNSRKDSQKVPTKSVEPKPVLAVTLTNANGSEAAISGPTQSRRKPFHRPRAPTRITQSAGSSQFDTAAKLGGIDPDGFQVATKRRGQVNKSVPGSPAPRGGATRQQGNRTKADSGRHQGEEDRQHVSVTHRNF